MSRRSRPRQWAAAPAGIDSPPGYHGRVTQPSRGPVDPGTPPVAARVLAFAAILVAGLCGGLIGFAFTDLQCEGACATPSALGALVGAVVAAAGVAVVAVLTLRAMGEWQTIRQRESTHASRDGGSPRHGQTDEAQPRAAPADSSNSRRPS